MNYAMLGFGEPIDDCMARNGIYNSATDTCWCQYGTNVNDGKCITSTEYEAMNAAAKSTPGDSGAPGVITTTTQQESWVSKNKNLLIGAVLVVGVLAVAKYA
jgi:hypothetical protein